MKLAAIVLTAALAASPVAAEPDTSRRVSGAVHVPTADAPGHLADVVARCEWLTKGGALAGDVIELIPAEGDGLHTFELIDGNMSAVDGLVAEPANFDIAFYEDLGACGDAADPPHAVRFREPLTDTGTIPAGSRYAVVTMSGKIVAGYALLIRS